MEIPACAGMTVVRGNDRTKNINIGIVIPEMRSIVRDLRTTP